MFSTVMVRREKDARFARVHTDPRFHRPRKDDTKVVLDERFKDVLTKGPKQLDRFGRKRHDTREAQDLERLYRLDSDADYARGEVELESSSEEDDDDEEEEEDDDDESGDVVVGGADAVRKAQRHDDDSDASIDLEEDFDEEAIAELDAQAHTQRDEDDERGDDTCRLAVVNMDWDHVRAVDLFKVFASIVSPQATRAPLAQAHDDNMALETVHGQVRSVRIYMSDFGRERLEREDIHGPPRAIFRKEAKRPAAQATEEGTEFDEDALRKYQLERLRYYYAIATFDSPQSARHVYNEIDGTEMERSANMFDLRFVPEEMDLPDGEDGRPAEYCDEATEDVAHYEGLDYKTDALRHSRVKLTWDQDDPRRTKLTRTSQKGQLHEDDLKTYLASSDEDDEEATSSRDRLRSLLHQMPAKSAFDDADDQDTMFTKPEGDMEISFVPALSTKKDEEHEETTIEKYMRKQKERRERRRMAKKESEPEAPEPAPEEPAASEEPTPGDSDDEHHFQLQDIVRAEKLGSKKLSRQQRKREAKRQAKRTALTQPSFVMDTKDPRFAAVLDDHRFAIDPSHPGFIKTSGMQQLIQEGNRRRHEQAEQAQPAAPNVADLVTRLKNQSARPPKKARRS